jgi:hypothetical protein
MGWNAAREDLELRFYLDIGRPGDHRTNVALMDAEP